VFSFGISNEICQHLLKCRRTSFSRKMKNSKDIQEALNLRLIALRKLDITI
jgi:hypothetical protein